MKKLVLALVVLLWSYGLVNAAIYTPVTNEGGITADGLIDWGVLGPSYTPVTPLNISVPGVSGLTAGVNNPYGDMMRRDQGDGWGGNFGAGEKLLWTGDMFSYGPIFLEFNNPVSGVGAQIQADTVGYPFTATLTLYDLNWNILASFTENGLSTATAGDDSAIFIGLLSDTANIDKVSFSVNAVDVDFAINGPRIQVAPVPEPSTILLLGVGLASVGFLRRKMKR